MKKFNFTIPFLLLVITTFSSCKAIADVFGAGFKLGIWVAVIIVILIIVLIAKSFGSKK